MAERFVNEGLEVEGTLHRAFPFRKRAERITVGNLPFFLMKAGPYVYNDGRREAFIILREGMTIERLPTRLDIPIKGEAWPAYLSSGIRCSRCRGQGHRRANCPLLAGRTTEPGPATPTSPTSVPPATAPKLPQQPSAKPPPPASPSPAMEVSDVPPASRAALLPPAALRSSPPAPLASPAEETPPPPPPVTPASPLRAPGGSVSPQSAKSQPSAQDIEMTTIEESSASSTASSRKSTREDLVTLIRKSPAVSFAETDALGLGREEILDLLSSKTRAQRQGPLLTPPQNEALAGMIKRLLGLRPGSNTSVYKVLRQVKSVLRTGPAAVPPTPTLTAPRPAKPTPPVPQRKESAPTRAASLLAMPIKTDEDRKRWLRDTFKELDHRNILRPILDWIDEDPIINSEDSFGLLGHRHRPASAVPSCPACGSVDRSLGHRYWSCSSIRPLIREAFNIIGRPPDLQAWIFGGSGFEDDALTILASAKLRVYRHFVQMFQMESRDFPVFQLY
ncbi:hypothetical protein LAZ67_22001019 [Cordylochernes scorpioides]|uniref:CCHC-type domain-containing protein n=1 Tax=Cordylochernes scorpioides TaxID=51811 RepID=A0ABY6LNZ8_9ARAC|nr:hypothetical protein LAZ67_22001019 [Cordylochernes scorpioides]